MKNLILVFAAIAISIGAYAQTDSTRKMSLRDMNNPQNQQVQNDSVNKLHLDGVIDSTNRKTKLHDIYNHRDQNMQNDSVNKLRHDGVINSTTRKTSLRDMSNHQNQQVQHNPVNKLHPDGVMMKNGKIMKVQDGKMTILDHDMTMSNGTKIMSDGTYIKKDGTKMMLKEGQHMDMSGNIISKKINKDKNMYLVPDSTMKKNY